MLIKFEEVSKKFGSVIALEDVSFEIKEGEFVFFTGRSGAGKSTIINLILGDSTPTSGQVWVDGYALEQLRQRELLELRRKMGVIYQDYRLLNQKTVRENILVALKVAGAKLDGVDKKLRNVLGVVGLADRMETFPNQLSKGELQRICLARALIVNPKLIMADEPTGNLDPQSGQEIVSLLEKINKKGTTIIMATHDSNIVDSKKKRVIKLDQGKLISDKKKGKYE